MGRLTQGLGGAVAVVAALALSGCGGNNLGASPGATSSTGSTTGTSAGGGSLVIGSGSFTESELMANMYADLLQNAGYQTSIQTVTNRELYEPALEKGTIDVVPEYAATMAEFLNQKKNGSGAAQVASSDIDRTMTVLRGLASPLGLTALEPGQAVDQNAFAVSKTYATQNDLTTLSDLGASGKTVSIAAGEECATRPFCEPGLKQTYGIKVSGINPLGVDTVQSKQSVKAGRDQMALVLTTDGTLNDFGLVVLDDDKHLQLSDNLLPMVNTKAAGDSKVADALNPLASTLTTDDLATLNERVDGEREKPETVARDYLQSKNLL